ncbi:MAG TPA: hypothetical protein VE783_04005 [Candidatus Limnocylindrales bacterium]|nr:hypothetical protein [Candidatus Limnocylindrales bacterium]
MFLGLFTSIGIAVAAAAGGAPSLATVPHVDLKRYMGLWYEIAR